MVIVDMNKIEKPYKFGDIVYFKPTYWPECKSGPLVDIFQVIDYDKENNVYKIIYFNTIDLDPAKPFLATVLDEDVDGIKNSIYKDEFDANHHYFPLDMDFSTLRNENIYKINEGIIYFLANREKYDNDLNFCMNKHPDKFHIIINKKK